MEAETVWHTWRRVLREPALQDAMFAGPMDQDTAHGLDLGPAQLDVVKAYAQAPAGTRFFIENYRFRMRSSFVNALETAAPLTHRLLRAKGIDVDALGVEFLDTVEWRDFGPYVYTFAGRVLEYLLTRDECRRTAGMADLIELERAGVRVVTAAADDGYDTGGTHDTPTASAHPWFEANPRSQTVHCALDVSAWLRDGATLGRTEPLARPRWYLVYLRAPDGERRIVAIPSRAVAIMEALRGTALDPAGLSAALTGRGHPGDAELDAKLLRQLTRIGAVRPRTGGA